MKTGCLNAPVVIFSVVSLCVAAEASTNLMLALSCEPGAAVFTPTSAVNMWDENVRGMFWPPTNPNNGKMSEGIMSADGRGQKDESHRCLISWKKKSQI